MKRMRELLSNVSYVILCGAFVLGMMACGNAENVDTDDSATDSDSDSDPDLGCGGQANEKPNGPASGRSCQGVALG